MLHFFHDITGYVTILNIYLIVDLTENKITSRKQQTSLLVRLNVLYFWF